MSCLCKLQIAPASVAPASETKRAHKKYGPGHTGALQEITVARAGGLAHPHTCVFAEVRQKTANSRCDTQSSGKPEAEAHSEKTPLAQLRCLRGRVVTVATWQ